MVGGVEVQITFGMGLWDTPVIKVWEDPEEAMDSSLISGLAQVISGSWGYRALCTHTHLRPVLAIDGYMGTSSSMVHWVKFCKDRA